MRPVLRNECSFFYPEFTEKKGVLAPLRTQDNAGGPLPGGGSSAVVSAAKSSSV